MSHALISQDQFMTLLTKYVKADEVRAQDVLFGSGLNISSIAFAEFIMDLEESFDMDIDMEQLDNSIVTAGQLHERIETAATA